MWNIFRKHGRLPEINLFRSDCIESVSFIISRDIFDWSRVKMLSRVKFKDGDMSGDYVIRATNFAELVRQTHVFISSLHNTQKNG